MTTNRRGELLNDEDWWVMVGELQVPASLIVSMARHQTGVGLESHLWLREHGMVTDEEHRKYMRQVELARGVLKDLGDLFPEQPLPPRVQTGRTTAQKRLPPFHNFPYNPKRDDS